MQEAADCHNQVVVKEWRAGRAAVYAYPLADLFPKSLFQKERYWLRWDCMPHRIDITGTIDPKEVRNSRAFEAVLPKKVWKLFQELGLLPGCEPGKSDFQEEENGKI
ncbi:MAG: hypothetical protein IKT97_07790, partial [Spirochaetia bacterium]|nr:hypothetical protein [Spirochaetia bacterium]